MTLSLKSHFRSLICAFREAAKKVIFFSVPGKKKGGGGENLATEKKLLYLNELKNPPQNVPTKLGGGGGVSLSGQSTKK